MSFLQVAIGGAVGAMLRHATLQAVAAPWGTLGINVLGSFLIGLLLVPAGRMGLSPLLLTGILGGFTTFSAFSLDTLRLWQGGAVATAAVYVLGSVLLSLAAVAAGAALFHQLATRGLA